MAPLHLLCILFCAVSVSGKLSQANLMVTSKKTMIGRTETIHCISRNASLPITYILFLNTRPVQSTTISEETGAAFNVTIYNETRLGPYKCKANTSLTDPTYSQEFTFILQGRLPQTELVPDSFSTIIGHTKTIYCISRNASLPITYILFLNKTTVERTTISEETGAAFNVTIYNETRLGPYKCKANTSLTDPTYSQEFTFILQVPFSGKLPKAELTVKSPKTMIGCTKTIHCISRNASLPITYILFLNKTTVERRTVSEETGAAFNVTIYNEKRLGPYKCKANNSLTDPTYSQEFTFILQGRLPRTELVPDSFSTIIGHTKTIHCISRNASLPITYILLLNITTVERRTVSEETGAAFNVTIYNETRLGPYKCKANISLTDPTYSQEFTFILQGQSNRHVYLAWLIPVLIMIGILGIIAYVRFVRHKRGRAGCQRDQYCAVEPINIREVENNRSEDEDVAYCTVVLERGSGGRAGCQRDQYCAVEPINIREGENNRSEDEDVAYCTVVLERGSGAIIKTEDSVEYVQVTKKTS